MTWRQGPPDGHAALPARLCHPWGLSGRVPSGPRPAGTDQPLSLPPAARIIRTKQWCDMRPCLEGEGCDLLINRSGWTCTQPGGRIKTTTVRSSPGLGRAGRVAHLGGRPSHQQCPDRRELFATSPLILPNLRRSLWGLIGLSLAVPSHPSPIRWSLRGSDRMALQACQTGVRSVLPQERSLVGVILFLGEMLELPPAPRPTEGLQGSAPWEKGPLKREDWGGSGPSSRHVLLPRLRVVAVRTENEIPKGYGVLSRIPATGPWELGDLGQCRGSPQGAHRTRGTSARSRPGCLRGTMQTGCFTVRPGNQLGAAAAGEPQSPHPHLRTGCGVGASAQAAPRPGHPPSDSHWSEVPGISGALGPRRQRWPEGP